jgi:pre-mRNA-splicing factor ATP-dependent RNA helicase DHX15/PRP43
MAFNFKLLNSVALVPNVWLRPNNQRREADAAKALLTVPDGDHLTMLNVYNEYVNSKGITFSVGNTV